jgi:asparaginyl-tRNA synthetase
MIDPLLDPSQPGLPQHGRIANLGSFCEGNSVTLKGWVNTFRSSGKVSFIELRDGSGYVQLVANHAALSEPVLAALKSLTQESSIEASGTVRRHPKKPSEFEIDLTGLNVVQLSSEYPLGKKDHGPDFLLENRHLWLRSRTQWAIQRVRDTLIHATYDFFRQLGFIKIDSPIITSTACEGTTTLFGLPYHELGTAYLSQSGQLYLEAGVMAHGRVYDFGPVFRAEKSKTKKHLSEFWMMDAEMAYCTHEQNMALQEQLICYMIEQVLKHNREDLAITQRDVSKLERIKAPFPRLTHRQAVEVLQSKGSSIGENDDLGAPDEALLSEIYDQPVFIERWPAEIKAFYMKRDPKNPKVVLGADLMAPEGYGELIGGSQREDDYEVLKGRMIAEGIPLEDFQWYLDLRRYGSVPHAGFGFGLERLVNWLAGAEHIRETIPFPRMLYRFKP